MPFYRFQIETLLPPEAAIQRIREITREPPGFLESIRFGFGSGERAVPPFLGKIEGQSFRLRRDIRYRNSFLPRIRGEVHQALPGSRIDVTMFIHPAVTLFMLLWLGFVGVAAGLVWMNPDSEGPATLIPVAMFAFGVALTLGGFIPEALKAKRLLEEALREHGGFALRR